MPQKKSAAKALRKSRKLFSRNQSLRKKIKDIRKKAERALLKKQPDVALDLFRQLQKVVDKASKASGFMKQNTVARYKSRLAKKIRRIRTGANT